MDLNPTALIILSETNVKEHSLKFCGDMILIVIWIVRVMKLLKDELPRLQEKYRIARRMKRAKKKGVLNSEGKR